MDTDSDYKTEFFGMERAVSLDISVPKIVASGVIIDRYEFKYYIMEYINGSLYGELEKGFTDSEKFEYARQLRVITDKLNTPCEPFNSIIIAEKAKEFELWSGMPISFQKQRLEYLETIQYQPLVFVHGDIHSDNLLIDNNKKLYVIDFADALLAPYAYELSALTGLFLFEKPYMESYFGSYDSEELAKQLLDGLLLHQFGCGIIKGTFNTEIDSIDMLYDLTLHALKYNTIQPGAAKS